jgi:hypothetical protein
MKATITLLPLGSSSSSLQQLKSGKNSALSFSINTSSTALIPTNSTIVKVLPKSVNTTLGTELKHHNDWITANHDIYGTRSSPQAIIGKDNVNKL